jgi:predicted transcriptional regulator
MSPNNWFKASSPAERSGDILVSFDSHWHDLLREGTIEYVVRRRYPKAFSPRRMFFYVGAPHSELIGVSSIKQLRAINFKAGLRILGKSGLTRRDLESYLSGYPEIGCYDVSRITLFKQALSLEALRSRSGFSPPQSFVALSRRASDWLDQQDMIDLPHGGRKQQRTHR